MLETYQALTVFFVAFAATYIMVPVSKRIAVFIGAIDYPSNRRLNTAPIPRCGGIALYVGFVAACLAVLVGERYLGWTIVDIYVLQDVNYSLLFIGITLMFSVGLVDDIVQLTAVPKFLGQVTAATVVALAGITIGTVRSLIDGRYVDLGVLDYSLTVVYLVVFVNITNLIDGLDGLAAGIVAIVSTSLLYLVFMRGSATLALACIALIAVCLAFLKFNFFPASIFMGDSGALLLGLMVGIISISGVVRTQSFVVMLVPLVIAGVPLLDTVSAVIRRALGYKPVGQADMGHIHHRLLRAGLGQRRAVAVLWLSSAVLAFVGTALGSFSGPVRWAIFFGLAVVVFFIVWRFGLFKLVLRHYFDNKGKRGPRTPHNHE